MKKPSDKEIAIFYLIAAVLALGGGIFLAWLFVKLVN